MQQIMYQQSPDIIFAYPDNLEAINTAKWTGWETMFGGSGPAWQAEGNIQSYLNLRPVAAGGTSGGSRGLLSPSSPVGAGGTCRSRSDRGRRVVGSWSARGAVCSSF